MHRANGCIVVRRQHEGEIDAAFATVGQGRAPALCSRCRRDSSVTRRDQLIALAARYGIATSYTMREYVEAGGLMSYGPNSDRCISPASAFTWAAFSKAPSRPTCRSMQPTKFELVHQSQDRQGARPRRARQRCSRCADEVIE